jgi:hypothetical protein
VRIAVDGADAPPAHARYAVLETRFTSRDL